MKPPRLLIALFLSSAATAGLPSPYLVEDIRPGSTGSFLAYSDSSQLNFVGNTLFFGANDGTHGEELWRSDGTAAGTSLVKDICPGTHGGRAWPSLAVGGHLYFAAHNSSSGVELWKSDGTAAGTAMVRDLYSSGEGSFPRPLLAVGNLLYFVANAELLGPQLWRTDGTSAGTIMVAHFDRTQGSKSISSTKAIGGICYFTAQSGKARELWRSDGTAAGTKLVKSIPSQATYHGSLFLTVAGNNLYFIANHVTHGTELWRSDGTEAGTTIVKDIAPGTGNGADGTGLTVAGDLLYFTASPSGDPSDLSLWRSDGTEAGTRPLLAVSGHSKATYAIGNDFYFIPSLPNGGTPLWKSDGSPSGTIPFKPDLKGDLRFLLAAGKGFYFGTRNDADLWQSDGSPEGTYAVGDLAILSGGSRPLLVDSKIFLQGYNGLAGNELYAYDVAPPSISRAAIRDRGRISARISLAVNPNGFASNAKLDYGLTESLGNAVFLPLSAGGDLNLFQSSGTLLTGLKPGATYHYRITASSSKGSRVSTGTFATSYSREDWRMSRFSTSQNSGTAADDADPDCDGLSNLIEYAFGLDPEKADADQLPKGTPSSDTIVHKFTSPSGTDDVVYGVEWSDTLAPGSWTAVQDTGTGNEHVFTVPALAAKRFIRWTITPK